MEFFNTIDLSGSGENFLHEIEIDCKEKILVLERALAEDPKQIESLRTWIACYHKLSEVYLHQQDIERAQKCLIFPHHSMLELANHGNADADEILIARKALNLTLPPLLAFSEQHPFCPHCMEYLKEQQAMLEKENAEYH